MYTKPYNQVMQLTLESLAPIVINSVVVDWRLAARAEADDLFVKLEEA